MGLRSIEWESLHPETSHPGLDSFLRKGVWSTSAHSPGDPPASLSVFESGELSSHAGHMGCLSEPQFLCLQTGDYSLHSLECCHHKDKQEQMLARRRRSWKPPSPQVRMWNDSSLRKRIYLSLQKLSVSYHLTQNFTRRCRPKRGSQASTQKHACSRCRQSPESGNNQTSTKG